MKDGYYWVKYKGKWVIARRCTYTSGTYWKIEEVVTYDEYFAEIGDYIETPDKYKE